MTVVEGNGYRADILAIDPSGAENLDLLRSKGSEQFYLCGPGEGAPSGPPVELRSFEADGGLTNKINLRLELNAGFAVERVAAGLGIL